MGWGRGGPGHCPSPLDQKCPNKIDNYLIFSWFRVLTLYLDIAEKLGKSNARARDIQSARVEMVNAAVALFEQNHPGARTNKKKGTAGVGEGTVSFYCGLMRLCGWVGVVVCCGLLWSVVVCCGLLWSVVVCCGVLWSVVVCCGLVRYGAMWCTLCDMTLYEVAWWYDMMCYK